MKVRQRYLSNAEDVQRKTAIAALSLGHACVDVYQGSVAALVPYFVAERHYTLAAASGLVLSVSIIASIVQPLFGVLTDRWSMPWLIPVSTVLSGVGIAASGLAGSYLLVLVFVAITGIGISAYHPESARIARQASEGSHRAMAYFSTGGNVGFAVAPLLVAAAIATGGLRWTPVLVLPALAGTALMLPVLAALRRHHARNQVAARIPAGPDDVPAFLRLSAAVIFRSVAFIGLSTFISIDIQHRLSGYAMAGTMALFVLYAGGIVGSVCGGALASRWDRVTVSRWSYLISALAIAGVIWTPGPAVYLCIAMTSVALYVPFSLQITLGQDYLPSRMGTASGVTLGLTVSIGGLISPVIGVLAEATTLHTALIPLCVMPIVSWLLFCTLTDPQQRADLRSPAVEDRAVVLGEPVVR